MWDLIGISNPQVETGRSLFNFNQSGYTDPSGIVWNFDTPWAREQDALAKANNPSGTGLGIPAAYNLGDQYYKDLGFQGQAWNTPGLDQQVSGGQTQGTMTPEFQQWLQDQGYTYGTGQAGSVPYRGYFDKYGNPVGSLQKGASDAGAIGDFIKNAVGLYTLGQGFGALSGATGATGATPALTGAEGGIAGASAAEQAALNAALAGQAGTAAGTVGTAAGVGNILSSLGSNDALKYLIPGIASLGSTYLQQQGISDAQEAQNNATAAANALAAQNLDKILGQQREIFDIQRKDQAPWLQAGQNALAKLNDIINQSPTAKKEFSYPEMGDVTQTPGYQFGMGEGLKAIDRTAAARGGALSGAAVKAATRYGNDYATTKYRDFSSDYQRDLNNAFSRYITQQQEDRAGRQEQLDPLYRAAGYGTTGLGYANSAASNYGNASSNALSNYGNTVGNNLINAGDYTGQAALARGNLYGNLLAQLGGLGYQYFKG